MYSVEYSGKAIKALQKMDKPVAAMLYGWIEKNLVNCTDPYKHGKALIGDKSGCWRYRVGAYRLITEIQEQDVKIIIAHRRDVYK